MEVLRTEKVTDHMMRVWLGGAGFDDFVPAGDAEAPDTDMYVKLHFPAPDGGDEPVLRTYTIRRYDPVAREIAIDFVVHGDEGVAGPWAANARPGDQIALSGPGGAYAPDPAADWHLFAGDESAIPAIGAALRHLADVAPDAAGVAYLEVDGAAGELALTAPAGIEVRWLHRGDVHAGESTILSDAVAAQPLPEGRVAAFVHGERECMKAIRDVLKPHGIPRADLSLSGYWAYGRTEDRFQAEKREPIGVVL